MTAPDAACVDEGMRARIGRALEEIRPYLRADGGDCELVDVDGDLVTVRLTGACVGCQFAGATVAGLQARLSEAVGLKLRVARVPGPR